jgi:hypothetical protein
MAVFRMKQTEINEYTKRRFLKFIFSFLLLTILFGCGGRSGPESAILGHWQEKDEEFDLYIGREVIWRSESDGYRKVFSYRIENIKREEFTFTLINIIDGEEFALNVSFSANRDTMFTTRVFEIQDKIVSGTITQKNEFVRIDDKTEPD